MQPTFADHIEFARARADRLERRAGARCLARRTSLSRRARCLAATAADTSPAAMPRALRMAWQGGYVALARAAGIDRIEPGCDPHIAPTCFAPGPRKCWPEKFRCETPVSRGGAHGRCLLDDRRQPTTTAHRAA